MKILTLDFEGSINNGIREIGAILSNDTQIINFHDFDIEDEIDCKNMLQSIISSDVDFIISHNIQTEKNLLKMYLPFPPKKNKFGQFEWGPWLDTRKVYSFLYPNIKNYELTNLTELFIKNESVLLTEKYCKVRKAKQHHALFVRISQQNKYHEIFVGISLQKKHRELFVGISLQKNIMKYL